MKAGIWKAPPPRPGGSENQPFVDTVLKHARNVLQAIGKAQLPVILATLVVATFCIFGEPLYYSNDDAGIAMVGSGFGEAAHPDPHLVWCHYGYGLILGMLTKFIGLNAHGWVTIAAIWLSLALLIQAIFHTQRPIVRWSLLLLSVGAIYSVALLSAQFTTTAGVLFGAAIACWLADGTPGRKSFLAIAPILLALILSYLIRPECYCLGVLVILPALLFLSFRSKRLVSRYTIMGFCLALIFVVGFFTDKLAYSTSHDWQSVPEYNGLRAQFNDYFLVQWRPDAPEYKAVGWTANDYWMFCSNYCRDPRYSFKNISFLVKRLAVPRTKIAVGQIQGWFYYPLTDYPLLIILAAQIAVSLLLKQELRFLGFLFLAGEIVAIALAAMIGKIAESASYVWYAASAITLMCLSASVDLTRPNNESRLWKLGLVLPGLLGVVAFGVVLVGHLQDTREASAYRKWIDENSDQLRHTVVVWNVGLRWECLITPTRIYPPFPELKIAGIDDLDSMPVESDMLKALRIDDLARKLCTDPEMRLFSVNDQIPVLTRFAEEHYGMTPVFKEIAHYDDTTGIYALAGFLPQH